MAQGNEAQGNVGDALVPSSPGAMNSGGFPSARTDISLFPGPLQAAQAAPKPKVRTDVSSGPDLSSLICYSESNL